MALMQRSHIVQALKVSCPSWCHLFVALLRAPSLALLLKALLSATAPPAALTGHAPPACYTRARATVPALLYCAPCAPKERHTARTGQAHCCNASAERLHCRACA